MKQKLLHSYGKRDINEYEVDIGEMGDNQIEIQTILGGICRSDIGAYAGLEGSMPLGHFGHESVGRVISKGSKINDIEIGDLVASFADPVYAYSFFAKQNEYVKVSEIHPRQILQPTACGINIWNETIRVVNGLLGDDLKENNKIRSNYRKILLIGSGFLSMVLAKAFLNSENSGKVQLDVVGRANQEFWRNCGLKRYNNLDEITDTYKVIIDLSSKAENFDIMVEKLAETEGIICYASTPTSPVTTNFFSACWKCLTLVLPSPRNTKFIEAMRQSEEMIRTGVINVDSQWTKGYARSDMNQIKQAFEDGVNRPKGEYGEYIRGYIDFRN